MFGGTGCGVQGGVYLWRQPAFHGLFLGFDEHQGQSEPVWCNATVFQSVNGCCLFLLSLMKWSEGEKWSEKRETHGDQVFFPSFRECFTL